MRNNYFFNIALLLALSITLSFAQGSGHTWPEMVKIEGDSFMLGANEKDLKAERDEKPARKVDVASFYMSKFEVTVWEWKEYTKATRKKMPPMQKWGWNDELPITNITWIDAIEFCNWLSKKHGYNEAYFKDGPSYICDFDSNGYRLPTEAEWEFAAQGGKNGKGYKYAGSNDLDLISWNVNNSEAKPHTYGTKYANELGIYDLSGNVWEWCWDIYDENHFKAVKDGYVQDPNARGPQRGKKRIVKGGSWDSKPSFCRISNKVATLPGNTFEFYGTSFIHTKR